MKTPRVISSALALCLTATAGSLVLLSAPASAATYAALQVGPRPNATRVDFKVGDRVDASVDVGTGNLLVLTTDLTLPGIDKDVQLGLDYNSLLVGSSSPAATSTAGAGWGTRLGDDTKLVTNDDGSMLYLAPGGLQGVYQPTAPGASTYTSPASFKSTLVKTASGWELTDHTSNAVSIFNSTGRLTSIRDRNAQSTTFTYTSGRVSKVTSTRGGTGAKVANVTYDGNGNLMGLDQTGDTGGTRGVDYMVDPYTNPNMLQYVQDTLGRQTSFGYDTSDRLNSITNTGGVQTKFTYDTSNRVTSVTRVDPSGPDPLTRFVYSSATQTLVADPNTDPAVAVATGPRTTYTINAAKRVTAVSDQLGRSQSTTYTPGQDVATSTSAGGGQTTFARTANGGESLTGVTSPTGASSTAAYANTGVGKYLPSSSTDAQGNGSTYGYDTAGNQTQTQNTGVPATAKVTYQTDGVIATSVDPRNNTTTYTRNATTHQISTITPPTGAGMGATSLTWDQFGRLKTATDGRGVITTYTYDLGDRITYIGYSDTTPTIGYTYDTAGNTKTRTETGAGIGVTYGYDVFDQLTSRTSASSGGTITNTYDLAGNIKSTTDAGGTTTYTYDAANQAISQTTSTGLKVDYAYNTDGDRTDTWFDTNAAHTTFAAHTHNDYDKAGRISRTWTSRDSVNSTRAVDLSYCYSPYVSGQACPTTSAATDSAKIRWSVDNTTAARSIYTYDAANRLLSATNYNGHNYAYTYDAAGNRLTTKVDGVTTQTLSYDTVNQISSSGYNYDAAGNRTTDSSGKTLTYDGANKMTSASGSSNTVTYQYAGGDQRELIARVTGAGTQFKYAYGREDTNGNPLLETFTRDGNLYSLDYDPDGTPIALNVPGGNQHFFALDGQGTTEALINDDGTQTGTYNYTPYGDILNATGPGDAVGQNVYRHQLGFIDSGTGGTNWTKHGVRWNDNTTATWTTQDTLSVLLDPETGNRYLFANGDPINNIDPTGRASGACIGAGLSFVGAGLSFVGSGISFASAPASSLAGVGAGVGLAGAGVGLVGNGVSLADTCKNG